MGKRDSETTIIYTIFLGLAIAVILVALGVTIDFCINEACTP